MRGGEGGGKRGVREERGTGDTNTGTEVLYYAQDEWRRAKITQ